MEKIQEVNGFLFQLEISIRELGEWLWFWKQFFYLKFDDGNWEIQVLFQQKKKDITSVIKVEGQRIVLTLLIYTPIL